MPSLVEPVVVPGTMHDLGQPELGAGRLRLRPWTTADAPAVAAAHADPAIRRWHLRRFDDDDEAADWIAGWPDAWQAERGASWAVVDRDGSLTGQVGLRGLALASGAAQLTYWVVPGHRRRGVASAAAEAAATWCFDHLGLHRLWLMHSVHNPASCRVATRTGFVPEGTWREALRHTDGWHDMHLHGRLATDPATSVAAGRS